MTSQRINEVIKKVKARSIKAPVHRRKHWFSIFATVCCPECGSYKFKKKRLTDQQTYQLYGYCDCGWEWIDPQRHSEPWDM